jgi:receptor expression-enhancing protein 1/2/3/4
MLVFIFSRLLACVFKPPIIVVFFTDWPSWALSGWFTFLSPSYSTFKALRQRPLHEQEVERWASYWIVVGAVVAFEYTAEWLLCW